MIEFLLSFLAAILNGNASIEVDRGGCTIDECLAPAIVITWVDTRWNDDETDFIIINPDGSIATGP